MSSPRQTTLPKNIEIYLLTILFLTTIVFWWSTINIPYWWDSVGYIIPSARSLVADNFLPLHVNINSDFAHPPLLVYILALSWKIFGSSLLTSHIINLFFAIGIVIFTYKLGQILSSKEQIGSLIGFGAGIILLFSPLFYAQLGIIYLELPMTCFVLASSYFYLSQKNRSYFLAASLMLLSKEISVFILLLLVLIEGYCNLVEQKLNYRKLLLIISPLIILITWFVYHQVTNGWYYVAPGKATNFSVQNLIGSSLPTFQFVFVDQWRFVISLVLIISGYKIFSKKYQKQLLSPASLLVILVPFAAVLTFGATEFLHRYILTTLPFLYLCFFYFLSLFLDNFNPRQVLILFSPIIIFMCFLFFLAWHSNTQTFEWSFPPYEYNLDYLDIIAITKNIGHFLETKHPGATVYSAFPLNFSLSDPANYYVSHAIKYRNCSDFKTGDKIEFMIFNFLSPGQLYCAKLTQDVKWTNALKFEKNGKFMMLYYKDSSDSATPSASLQ